MPANGEKHRWVPARVRRDVRPLETAMQPRPRELRPEPRTATGEILLSRSHLALLHGLLDRPDCTAPSYLDWERAALPYLRRFTPHATI